MDISKIVTGSPIFKLDANNSAKTIKSEDKIEKTSHKVSITNLDKKSISKEGNSIKSIDFTSENNLTIDKELFPNGLKALTLLM